ncbi:hypothetical protein BDV25DRAFT_153658 [Aspergillus avenaceus]|uniref:Uncharacterized protein n=1 Tax=Aspergillus avenaceus TaxID=36643 RepID=A0A5N6TXV3_ASPAV|nr:hypothetical protein BDV25DRAFT_153658 [Aspergillus avenaceus]
MIYPLVSHPLFFPLVTLPVTGDCFSFSFSSLLLFTEIFRWSETNTCRFSISRVSSMGPLVLFPLWFNESLFRLERIHTQVESICLPRGPSTMVSRARSQLFKIRKGLFPK